MKTKIICLGICFALFLAACSGRKDGYEIAHSATDSTSVLSKADTSAALKLIKKGDMRFKVKNVQHACEEVANLTAGYNGMVMHHAMQSQAIGNYESPLNNDSLLHVSAYSTTADMIVRIPSGRLEDFMNQLNRMAIYTDTRNMDIEDKTLDYLSTSMKVRSRSEIIGQQPTNNIKIKNAESVMALKDDVIDKRIENKRIDNDVKYSTIGLNFYQANTIVKEVRVNDDPSNFKVPFFIQLKNSIANGWGGFNEVLVFFANIWVLFVLAAIAWYGYFIYKRKQAAKIA